MFNAIKMSVKLPITMIALCSFVGISMATIAYFQSRETLLLQAEEQLDALMQERAAQLERWADGVEADMIIYGADPTVQEAIVAFENTHRLIQGDPTEMLQSVYIDQNPFPAGERDALVEPEVAHPYHMQHAQLHPYFRNLKDTNEYYDIFLFTTKGDLVYSVYKEADYATNFYTGPYADSGLGRVFQAAMELEPGQLAIDDYAPYAPSAGAAAAFVGTPVVGEWGDVIGVFAIQLPSSVIAGIVSNEIGLGDTGDIVTVAPDLAARSHSRFADGVAVLGNYISADRFAQFQSTPDLILVDVEGYQWPEVVTLAEPVRVLGMDWHLIAEKDLAEVLEPAIQLQKFLIGAGLVGIIASGFVGVLFAMTVTRPLSRLRASMVQVAKRKTGVEVTDTARGDEIGDIAKTLVSFRDQLDESDAQEALRQEEHAAQADVVDHLNEALTALAEGDLTRKISTPFSSQFEDLRKNFNRSIDQLSNTIATLVSNANAIRNGANEVAEGSNNLSQRTENQAATLEQTAAALDELTSNVKTVAASAKDAEEAVDEAKTDALKSAPIVKDAVTAMTMIETSSGAISEIISVINDIAFQTNLLALNAGVEAARAGEAGRGFAVVAAEVQALAQRTTDASKQISDLIEDSVTNVARGVSLVGDAGSSLTRIVERVGHISELVTVIASSVDEQAIALGEINMGVSNLDQVTQQNASMVETTSQNSQMLNLGAQQLSEAAAHFQINDEISRAEAA